MTDMAGKAASTSNLVVVTGFGPYRNYIVNSSWEAVKEFSKLGLDKNVELKVMEFPVKYSEVEKKVRHIWTELKPQLSVHVGMVSSAKAITLEQCARNKGYMEKDLSGALPQGGCCLLGGPERIESVVNIKSVCKNIAQPEIDVIRSCDAGRYLCEYTYYISLHYGERKAVFIHVPSLKRTITAAKLAHVLRLIIKEVMSQIG
ncbi:pyroglutamyl-peptidase 1-like protein [Bombina bombina]|uniref:pyroglutamyl-peptidase 1-like protein n=1 Tax=Bombina bombina TaxID=8345 RepID=UPI00235B2947|nr:pyroglutamyl-peptidase 1-like protein [Bombina bombina]